MNKLKKMHILILSSWYTTKNNHLSSIFFKEQSEALAKQSINVGGIEHIGNPVDFLHSIRERFKHNVDKIVLTTPNAFRWNNFVNSFKNIEVVNTDYRFWFTPFTLSKIVIHASYIITTLGYFEHEKITRSAIFRKFILNRYVTFRDTLIIEIGFNK